MVPTVPSFRKIDPDSIPQDRYLQRQLIAYIGNKRSLLPFLARVFTQLEEKQPVRSFLDPFAGSGAVSRLAKALGYAVEASDWEFYSWAGNFAFLSCDASELESMFDHSGGVERILSELNSAGSRRGDEVHDPYISRYYAPEDTESADYRRERLFYTRENALFLDRVRHRIEEMYPGWELEGKVLKEKALLVGLLLYEAATHANTSGVFKAYHKGFGGHSGDALGRILSPMRLEYPELVNGRFPCTAQRADAVEFVSTRGADLVYLDPPYNSHQYGSNYFMLNTIARWDRPPVSTETREDGRLVRKAGIREDWVDTRSAYCYRRSAPVELRRLLDAIDARFIALSYSTDGIIPFEELAGILSSHGKVHLFDTDYTMYRGGKQSLARRNENVEFLIVVERGAGRGASASKNAAPSQAERFRAFRLVTEVRGLLRRPFHPARLQEVFGATNDVLPIGVSGDPARVLLQLEHGYRVPAGQTEAFDEVAALVAGMDGSQLEDLHQRLSSCVCANHLEEANVLLAILDRTSESAAFPVPGGAGKHPDRRRPLVRRLLVLMRKFANRKYRTEFEEFHAEVLRRVRTHPDRYPGLAAGLEELYRLFEARLKG